ncbi:MAG: hypothetical protein MJ061_06620, partial [Mailhella sp.]|nr:hypothetical protein [Mailhella sp.]
SLPADAPSAVAQAVHTPSQAPAAASPQGAAGSIASVVAGIAGAAAQQGSAQHGSAGTAASAIAAAAGMGSSGSHAQQQSAAAASAGAVLSALPGSSGVMPASGAAGVVTALVGAGVAATLGDVLDQMSAHGGQGGIGYISELVAANSQMIMNAIAPMGRLDISSLEDHPVEIVRKDGEPGVELHLDPAKARHLDSVGFELAYFSEEKDIIVFLGGDVNMDRNWEKGLFRDNFTGTWASLDGHPVFLEVTADVEDFNYYAVPVRLNGERCNLEVSYDFKAQRYYLIGARRAMENGLVDKNLIKLKEGDRITPILKKLTISGDDHDPVDFDGESFVLGRSWKFEDSELRDGDYAYMFSMKDIQGNEATSDIARITLRKGEISYEKM